jgi:hypothetical protein
LQQTYKLASFDYLTLPLRKQNASNARTKLLTKTAKTRTPANALLKGAKCLAKISDEGAQAKRFASF